MANQKLWLSGNEAIALGAYEAGVTVASGYPGTPSTEILENFCKYKDAYTEWAPNEKVGLEVAIGASFAGARALATMKHVGVNVAADPLFTVSYTGCNGGLVIITADDPEMHSSQNEQDNRNYALASKIMMLEPSDPEEAKNFVKLGFSLSEEFDTPVLVRTTTRLSHVKSIVYEGEKESSTANLEIPGNPGKMVMLPANARQRRIDIEERYKKLQDFAENFSENKIEANMNDNSIGFITSGVSYLYVKEAFPEASVLKLGMVYPLPEKLIKKFAGQVKKLYIIEELDPFLETQIKAMGIECTGKDLIPAIGELNTGIIKTAITGKKTAPCFTPLELPPRPPNMCPGCPHRGLFYNLSRLKVFVSGDIGCYTLGFLPPLSAMDSCVCMGASIGIAHGMSKALEQKDNEKKEDEKKIVAVLGDSTFIHSGITGLINMAYNNSYATVIILDNRITGMTGQQPNPASGTTINGSEASVIDFEKLCLSIGINKVLTTNPHDIKKSYKILKEAIDHPEPSVVISRFPCVLLPGEKKRVKTPLQSDISKCTGCRKCLKLGCPAIHWTSLSPEQAKAAGYKEKQQGFAKIDQTLCIGCGQCLTLCKFEAIVK
jgi:indolepyruvate ferredoxin oxidoreductase, alpha subunit